MESDEKSTAPRVRVKFDPLILKKGNKMIKSQFDVWPNGHDPKKKPFIQVGDYVLLRNEAERKDYDDRSFNTTNCLDIKNYPVLVSLCEGEENMTFIPLTKDDLLEMIKIIDDNKI